MVELIFTDHTGERETVNCYNCGKPFSESYKEDKQDADQGEMLVCTECYGRGAYLLSALER